MIFIQKELLTDESKICYLGEINKQNAIIITNTYIDETELNIDEYHLESKNDRYWKYSKEDIELLLIYPATIETIEIFRGKMKIIEETSDNYYALVKPYIDSIKKSNTKWIFNILSKNTEKKRVKFRNTEFILAKNITWDDNNPNHFYVLTIPFKKITTIRELNKNDIPLLNQMKNKIIEYAQSYGLDESELYLFFHYHPSFYQLHLHGVNVNNNHLTSNYLRIHKLDDILNNLKNDSEYYHKYKMKFEIPNTHKIYKLLKNNNNNE